MKSTIIQKYFILKPPEKEKSQTMSIINVIGFDSVTTTRLVQPLII